MSDDCLRILCNRREQDSSLVLDTTVEDAATAAKDEEEEISRTSCSQNSCASDIISDQDLRCAKELAAVPERRVLRQVSPLPKGVIISGTPILNGENSGNAVFNHIGVSGEEATSAGQSKAAAADTGTEDLTFNGRIPAPPPPRPDHVIIQIEPDESVGNVAEADEAEEGKTSAVEKSFEYENEQSPDLFADYDEDEGHVEEEDEDEDDEELDEGIADVVRDPAGSEAAKRLLLRDNHLLKRMQTACSGVLPPPCVTNVNISLDYIVNKYREFNGRLPESKQTGEQQQDDSDKQLYLLKSVDAPERARNESWPELKNVICQDV